MRPDESGLDEFVCSRALAFWANPLALLHPDRIQSAGLSPGTTGLLLKKTVKIELLVDFKEFWARLQRDISAANQSVFVQTFALEGDTVGRDLAQALLLSPASDRRILADSFTRAVLSDRFKYSPAALTDRALRDEARQTQAMRQGLGRAGVRIQFTNPYALSPRRLLSRNHKKLILIDNRTAYIGGINFSEHNAAWHDMMLRIEDPKVVSFLRADFLRTWNGEDRVASEQFDGIEMLTTDGRTNRSVFQRVFEAIDTARDSIFVESPYVTFPFYERLREASRRGVSVTVLTPEQNNWRFFRNYARLESARSSIDLRLFPSRMSHLKAMLIDGRCLIAGSSNFDYLSYRLHQELIAFITDQDLIGEFRRRVLRPDLANSIAVDCRAGALSRHWVRVQAKVLDAGLTILS
jgi:cardiolipin synthase